MEPDAIVVAPSAPPQPSPEVAAAAVEIAEIEANRDVTIAEIHAEQTDAELEDDLAWLRGELDGLRQRCETNEGELSSLRAAVLTLSEQNQTMAEQITRLTAAAMVTEQVLTQGEGEPSTPEPGSEPPNPSGEGEEGQEKKEGETPPPEPPPAPPKRKRVWLK